jgi:hypothetical protein
MVLAMAKGRWIKTGTFGCRRMLAAAFIAVFLPAGVAEASSRACRQLETQLASLGKGNNASPQARKYDAAISRQQGQMEKARSQMQQAGCGSSVFGQSASFCRGVKESMARMEKNMAELKRTRARLGGSGSSGNTRKERSRILAALDANGCRDAPPAQAAVQPKANGSVDERGTRISLAPRPTGNLRTMCVRTCDGYYFPISWSVSHRDFARDHQVCASMCPGVEVELYYHRIPNEESADMVSAATGQPYSGMPYAFRYRKPGLPPQQGCTCTATAAAPSDGSAGYSVIGGDYSNEPVREAETTTAAAEEPEMFGPPAPPPHILPPDENRPIRVVGPQFLPGPEAATGQPVPDRGPAL